MTVCDRMSSLSRRQFDFRKTRLRQGCTKSISRCRGWSSCVREPNLLSAAPRIGVSPLPAFPVGKTPDSHGRAPKLGSRESLEARLGVGACVGVLILAGGLNRDYQSIDFSPGIIISLRLVQLLPPLSSVTSRIHAERTTITGLCFSESQDTSPT